MLRRVLLALSPFMVLAALGQGQDSGELTIPDLQTLFSSPHALALFIVGLISFVRKHFPITKLDGIVVPALSLILGLVLAFVGKLLGYLGDNWLFFGLMAGIEAPLIVSGARTLLSKTAGTPATEVGGGGNAQASADSTTPERTRLR